MTTCIATLLKYGCYSNTFYGCPRDCLKTNPIGCYNNTCNKGGQNRGAKGAMAPLKFKDPP